MDYIYQGPIILVLLVGSQWGLGGGWSMGRTAEEKIWPGQQPEPTLLPPYPPPCFSSPPSNPFLRLCALGQPWVLLWTSGSFSGWRKSLTR